MAKEFKPGIYDISNDEYHASSAVSRSDLMLMSKSPHHYLNKDLIKYKESPSMLVGSLVHTLVLEPNLYKEQYYVAEKVNKSTTKGKERFAEMKLEAAGRIMISESDYLKAKNMSGAVLADHIARGIIESCVYEQSYFWQDPEFDISLKSRPDATRGRLAVDLKTAADASEYAFQSSAYKYGYFMQAAMIREAMRSQDVLMEMFSIVVVESVAPWTVGIYLIEEDDLDLGYQQMRNALSRMNKCLQNNSWPGYGVHSLKFPGYAKYELENGENNE